MPNEHKCPTCGQDWPKRPHCDKCGEPLSLRGEICTNVVWDHHRTCDYCGECVPVEQQAYLEYHAYKGGGTKVFHKGRDCCGKWCQDRSAEGV